MLGAAICTNAVGVILHLCNGRVILTRLQEGGNDC